MKDEVVVGEIFEIDISDKIQEVYPKLMDLEVTPSKEQQIFNHEGEYGYDNVTVNAVTSSIDENIKSENIKNGINILGIEGTLKPGKPEQTKTITSSKEEQMVVPDEGFELSKVIVKPIPLQVKEVVPSTEAIEVVPDEQNFVLEKVVVLPAPLQIKETKSKPSEIVEVMPEGENIGLKKVIVNPIILSNKTIVPTKELQKVEPNIDTDGLSYVNIEPIPDEYIIPSGELEITENGTYDVTDKANAIVNVPEKTLGTKSITSNGTYKAVDDNLDGYNQVSVNVPPSGLDEYFNNSIGVGYKTLPSWIKGIKKLPPFTFNGTNADYLFKGCLINDVDLSNIDFSNVTSARYAFSDTRIDTVDLSHTNTSNLKRADYMFLGLDNGQCPITISELDFGKVINVYSIFSQGYFPRTENLGGFKDYGKAFDTSVSSNYSDYELRLIECKSLTEQSIINVLNDLYDIATKGCNTQSIVLGSTNLAKLTSEEGQLALTNAQNKGWTIS